MNLKSQAPYVIVGIGKSGLAAKKFLLAAGLSTEDVWTFDEKNSEAQFSKWDEILKLPIGTLVVSPGVPLNSESITQLKHLGWRITSEINLACSVLTDETLVGITGSVGKSTVTSLIGAAAQADDPQAFVGGNLGVPFCEYGLRILQKKSKARYVILELSSYQLENAQKLHLDFSAITFLSANHLERYPSADAYYMTKCQIGAMSKNICVLNGSSTDLLKYQNRIAGQTLVTHYASSAEKSLLQQSQLIGEHNLDNVAVALAVVRQMKLSDKAIKALLHFSGLPHRLESVGIFNDVLFINDSKATAMDSVLVATQAALSKVTAGGHLHLLLGGKDKNLPWEELHTLSRFNNIKFYFFGQCGSLAQTKSKLEGAVFTKMADALNIIFTKIKSGDVVLLSPGGTSLDEFKNFEDRGNIFKLLVQSQYCRDV